jgi:hypothetical protein
LVFDFFGFFPCFLNFLSQTCQKSEKIKNPKNFNPVYLSRFKRYEDVMSYILNRFDMKNRFLIFFWARAPVEWYQKSDFPVFFSVVRVFMHAPRAQARAPPKNFKNVFP